MYRPSREETEAVIKQLTVAYPKCFFEIPQLRRPLKKNIVADLHQDGFGVAPELLSAAICWYESHFGYQHALQPGAKRINLQGKEVGTVTSVEALGAQKKIKEDKERVRSSPSGVLRDLYRKGHVPEDQLKKLDAVPMKKTPEHKPEKLAPDNSVAPALVELHEALLVANELLSGDRYPTLKSAMASAALGVVIAEAQKVRDALGNG